MFSEWEQLAEPVEPAAWRAYLFSRGVFLPERQPPGFVLDEREAA
jgi:hypothetical protein